MKVVLQQLGLRDPGEAGQCFSDRLEGPYFGGSTMTTPGWLAEVVLVGGVGIGRLDLHKLDKALGEPAESRAGPEVSLVGRFQRRLLAQFQLAGRPAQEGVSLPQALQVFPSSNSLQQAVGTLLNGTGSWPTVLASSICWAPSNPKSA